MGLRANEAAPQLAAVEEFDAANFTIDSVDQPDGESDDISQEALIEMGIIEAPKPKVESNQAKKKEVADLGEKPSVEAILKALATDNPLEFDAKDEEELPESEDGESEPKAEDDKDGDQPEEESKFVLTHKGEEKEFTEKELVELAQKGFDYTQKTQDISSQKEAIERQRQEFEELKDQQIAAFNERVAKIEDELNHKQQWDFVIDSIKQENPDLYQEIEDHYKTVTMTYSNPMYKAMERRLNELESRGIQSTDQSILKEFDSEFSDLSKSVIPQFEKLGIKVDKDQIRAKWAKGDGSVKEALYALHGDSVTKLYASKAKVGAVQNRASIRKVATRGNLSTAKESKDLPVKGSYHDITKKLLGFK